MSKAYHQYVKQPFEFQKQLLQLFKRKSELVIFDIGSCEGEDSIKYATLFPKLKVFAFEPLPANIEKISTYVNQYGKSNITICATALSNHTGTATFFVSSGAPKGLENNQEWDYGNKSSSLLPPDLVTEKFDWLKFEQRIIVPTQTLDHFCDENQIDRVDFIHLDVQGAELMVLDGAKTQIKRCTAIWLEVERVSLYKDQPLKAQIEDYLKSENFVKIIDTVGEISGDQLYVNALLVQEIPRTTWGSALFSWAKTKTGG